MDNSKAPVTGGNASEGDANRLQVPLRRRPYSEQEGIVPAAVADDRIVLVARARHVILARRFLRALQAYRPLAFRLDRARVGLIQVTFATAAIAAGLTVNLLSQGSAIDSLPGTSFLVALFMLIVVVMAALFLLIKAISEENANWMKGAAMILLAVAVVLVLSQLLPLEP